MVYNTIRGYCFPFIVLNKQPSVESLRNYFTQFGKVDACTIMRDAAGRSRCFAFLTFEDPASVNAVMVREHFLDGKVVCLEKKAFFFGITAHFWAHKERIYRLTQRGRYLVKNTSGPRSCSLAAYLGVSLPNLCASFSASSAR